MSSKAAFVRSLPRGLTAKEVVQKAKAAGIKLSTAYVYVLRSKGGPSKPNGLKPGPKPKASSDEAAFLGLALDVGLDRASELIRRIRAAARTL